MCIGEVMVGVIGARPAPGAALAAGRVNGFRSLGVNPGVSVLATFCEITCWRSAR